MNPFLEACGATSSLELSIECQGARQAEGVTFDLPFVVIGRDSRADLHFPHQDVGERHVYLQMVAGHLSYMDLGSRMGTFLGGKCLRSGWLPRRQSIRVGPYRVRLIGGDSGERLNTDRPAGAAHGLAPPPLPDSSAPSLALELHHRGIRPALCPIRGDLTLIGSSADCDIRVLDPSVSNFHCSLLQTTSGVWVVDLLGCGGVTVNDAAVRYARLDDGDALRIGHSLIRLRVESTSAVTACAFTIPTVHMAGPEPPLLLEPVGAAIDSAVLPALDQGELVEAILSPLAEQFDLMRQQMFEQLQQVGVAMVERFAAIQEEQVRALRDELEEFRRVARELDALRGDLAAQSERLNNTAVFPTRLGMATAVPGRPLRANGAIVLARPESNGHVNGHVNGHANGKPQPEPCATTEEPVIRLGRVQERPTTEPRPDAASTADIHTWLRHRMTLVQKEQESRWQKILRLIPGQLLGKPTG